MKTRKPKPNPLAHLQSAKPLDWGKTFEALKYFQKDKHTGAALHANANGTWMVIPTIRVYDPADGIDAEKLAKAFFESLRDEPVDEMDRFDGGKSQPCVMPKRLANYSAAHQAARKPSNSARKHSAKGRTRDGALDWLKSGKEAGK